MLALLVLVLAGLPELLVVDLVEARSMELKLLRLAAAVSCIKGSSPLVWLPTCHTWFTLLLLDGSTTVANIVIIPFSYIELRWVAEKLIAEGTKAACLEVTL